MLLVAVLAGPAVAQKTDIVDIRRGSRVIGEIKGLQYGKLQLSTWAMSTIFIEWPKVSAITTDKEFEIELTDGSRYFGSVKAAQDSGSVVIEYGTQSIQVETQTIVRLKRLKPNFWSALDGSVDLGVTYTQQNNKVDFSFGATLKYNSNLNNYRFTLNSAFTQQDTVDNISQATGKFIYLRESKSLWVYEVYLSGEESSQLDLDFRGTVGVGPGRYFIQTNAANLAVLAGVAYAHERYTGESPDYVVPGYFGVDFQYWNWGALDRELTTGVAVLPMLTGASRWRFQFALSFKWEIASHLYVNVSLNEDYDTNPPSETANKNSFNTTTSLGWSF
jgi:hypothetical protein